MSAASTSIESAAASATPSSQTWFKRVMWLGILANLAVGLLLICWPAWTLAIFHLAEPFPTIWARHSGLILISMTLFYLPAALCPLGFLYNAIMAIVARIMGIVFFLIAWDVYLWFAAFDALFALPQAVLLWRSWRDDLMSKP